MVKKKRQDHNKVKKNIQSIYNDDSLDIRHEKIKYLSSKNEAFSVASPTKTKNFKELSSNSSYIKSSISSECEPDTSIVAILRSENERLREELLQFDALQETNQKLNKELGEARVALKKQSSELRKSSASLSSQLDAAQHEKNELSRRFWNLNEDCNELNSDLESLKQERDDAIRKYDELRSKQKKERSNAVEKEKAILLELGRVQSKLEDVVCQSARQKEMNEERVGGLEEAICTLRGEASSAEEERIVLVQQVDSASAKLEEENNRSIHLKAEADGLNVKLAEQKNTIDELKVSLEKSRCSYEEQIEAERKERKKQQEYNNELEKAIEVAKESQREEHENDMETIFLLKTQIDEKHTHIEVLKEKIDDLDNASTHAAKEAQQKEAAMRNELSELKQLCNGLQSELELRLQELSSEQKRVGQLSQELSEIKNNALIEADEQEQNISALEKEKEGLMNKFETYVAQCHRLEQEKVELLAESKQLQTEIEGVKSETKRLIDVAKNQKDEEVAKITGQLKESTSACTKLASELEKLENIEEQFILSQEENDKLCNEMESTKKTIKETQAKTEEAAKTLKTQSDQLQQTIAKLKEENISLQNDIEHQAGMLKKIELERGELMDRCGSMKAKYDEDSNLKEEQIDGLKDNMTKIEKKKVELEIVLNESRIELSDLKRNLASLRGENQRLNQIVRSSESTAQVLDEQLQCTKDDNVILFKEIEDAKEKISKMEAEKEQYVEQSEKNNDMLMSQLNELKSCLCEQENALEMQERQFIECEDESTKQQVHLQGTIDDLSIELSILKETLSREKERNAKKIESLKIQIANYNKEKEVLSGKFKSEMTEMRKQIDIHQENLCQMESEKDGLWAQLEGKSRELERTKCEIDSLKGSIKAREKREQLRKSVSKRATIENVLPFRISASVDNDVFDENQKPTKNIKKSKEEKITINYVSSTGAHVDGSDDIPDINRSNQTTISEIGDQFAETANWPMKTDTGERENRTDSTSISEFSGDVINKATQFLVQRNHSVNSSTRPSEKGRTKGKAMKQNLEQHSNHSMFPAISNK